MEIILLMGSLSALFIGILAFCAGDWIWSIICTLIIFGLFSLNFYIKSLDPEVIETEISVEDISVRSSDLVLEKGLRLIKIEERWPFCIDSRITYKVVR